VKEDIRNLKKGIVWKTASTGINALVGFAMSVIFARFLGKDIYGELILVYTVVTLFALICNFGLHSALQRFIPLYIAQKDEKKFTRFVLTSVCLGLFFTVLSSLVMFFTAGAVSTHIFRKPWLFPYMRWGALYLFGFSFLTNIIFSAYHGFQRWRAECMLNAAYLFLLILAVFITLSVFDKGIIAVLKVSAAVCLATALAGVFHIAGFIKLSKIPLKIEEFASQAKETLSFSTPLFVNGLIFYTMMWFDKILLGRYRPLEEVTQYYVAFALGTGILMFIKVSETVFTPYLAKFTGESFEVLKSKFETIFRLLLHLPITLSIFLYFFIGPFIRFVYGPDFGIAVTALKIYLALIILRSSMTPVGLFLVNVYGKTLEATKIGLISALIHLVLYFVLIPRYGYIGALAASIISYIVIWFYIAFFVKCINRLIPRRSALYAAAGMISVTGITFIAGHFHFYNRLILSVALAGAYLLFVFLKGDIDIRKIRNAV